MSATWSQHYKGVTCKMSKVFKSTDGFSARKNMSEKYVEYFAYKVHIYIYIERERFFRSFTTFATMVARDGSKVMQGA